ncbi:MAG: Asp-tRNA(Asn)/Glu-tRNA(Gln) amidotransferase subunit GatC [Candidatus Pacebacteria bacterium]|nr:Asp-tRNA(Asn)/Glu-tRNA(Gln) amidotransferase subunit GatC [Candidatus Paceibacterota bacterium]
MITRKEVERVAKLARIGISKKEEEKFARELSLILDYVKKLKEVDISKTLPTSHSIEIENVTREDHVQISKKLGRAGKEKIAEKLLKLAPETKDSYLKVKSIL